MAQDINIPTEQVHSSAYPAMYEYGVRASHNFLPSLWEAQGVGFANIVEHL